MNGAMKSGSIQVQREENTTPRDLFCRDYRSLEVAGNKVIRFEVENLSKPAAVFPELSVNEAGVADRTADAGVGIDLQRNRKVRLLTPGHNDPRAAGPLAGHRFGKGRSCGTAGINSQEQNYPEEHRYPDGPPQASFHAQGPFLFREWPWSS